ncbi:MAG TPA: C4-type zinc ribbon domain-containing protein, partial [candidate division Zixibacteria bacterium]|nr:C4-type zinc ribbon domain-containing protein [candidate division Zixibacteria bacterium]
KEYMPDMMGTLKNEMETAQQAFTNARTELTELKARQKTAEVELGSMQEDLKRYQSQMMSIKTNKEYDALVHEIDAIKAKITDQESLILTMQERMEEIEGSLETLESNASQIGDTNAKQLESLKERLETVDTKKLEREHERQKIVKEVSRQTMSIYERVRRGKGASVVAPVRKGACSGCFKTVPPQRLQEIKRGVRVIACDSCGRLLIPEEDGE